MQTINIPKLPKRFRTQFANISHIQKIFDIRFSAKAQTMTNIKSKTALVLIYDQHHKLDNVGRGNLNQYQPSFFVSTKKMYVHVYLICKIYKTTEILKKLLGRAETKV